MFLGPWVIIRDFEKKCILTVMSRWMSELISTHINENWDQHFYLNEFMIPTFLYLGSLVEIMKKCIVTGMSGLMSEFLSTHTNENWDEHFYFNEFMIPMFLYLESLVEIVNKIVSSLACQDQCRNSYRNMQMKTEIDIFILMKAWFQRSFTWSHC